MVELWKRLEAWRRAHAPTSLFRPRPPAKAKAIAAAEKKMKLAFPPDFVASLLVHDGEEDYDGDPARFDWMPGCDRLAPLASIVEQWADEQENAEEDDDGDARIVEGGRFRNVLWSPRRIPIAGSPYWDGDNTYLDFIPGPKGTDGQLVTMVTECDFVVLAPSFRAAFEGHVELLESGVWPPKKIAGHPSGVFAKLLAKRGAPAAPAAKPKPSAKGTPSKPVAKAPVKEAAAKKPTKKR